MTASWKRDIMLIMGIITDPGYTLIGQDCVRYFGTDYTPKKVYAGFTGIGGGGPPRTDFSAPTNGVWRLEQVEACRWENTINTITCSFWILVGEMHLTLHSIMDGMHFIGTVDGYPQFHWANGLAPGAAWTGGQGTVTTRAQWANPPASIQGVMGLMNIEPHAKTFAEFMPQSDGKIWHRFARKSDSSCLNVKIDPAFF